MFIWCFHHDERWFISFVSCPSPLFTHEVNLCTHIRLLIGVKGCYAPPRSMTLVILVRVYQYRWPVAPRLELPRWWYPIAVYQSCSWLSWLRFCKIWAREGLDSFYALTFDWVTSSCLFSNAPVSNRSKDSLSIAVKAAHPSLSAVCCMSIWRRITSVPSLILSSAYSVSARSLIWPYYPFNKTAPTIFLPLERLRVSTHLYSVRVWLQYDLDRHADGHDKVRPFLLQDYWWQNYVKSHHTIITDVSKMSAMKD
jgi:hypothetical protein